jgi:anti-sigma regulatory factor (Ser/Thr protein kinase)
MDVPRRRLRFLNSTAKELRAEKVPFIAADLADGALQRLDGQPATTSDLPLYVAWRDGLPANAQFLLNRPGGEFWQVDWSASPVWKNRSQLQGIVATVSCGVPGIDPLRLAELAHDMRTPLQALQLHGSLLERLLSSGKDVRASLEALRAASNRAVQIAVELLENCRGPVSRTRPEGFQWCPLEPFLKAMADEQTPAAEAKGLVLHTECAAVHGLEVWCVPLRLGRLLANLLVNAVRYTPRGNITLRAAWRYESAERLLALSVVDTGPGISAEECESIFHPYERGKAGHEEDSGGSGLGLAIVERLAKELGVRVELESGSGSGSTFLLLLPAKLLRQTAVP